MSSANRMVRIHAPFVSEDEIEKINKHLRSQEEPDYVDEILNFKDEKEMGENVTESGEKAVNAQMEAGDFIEALNVLRAAALALVCEEGWEKSWKLIPNPELDPWWKADDNNNNKEEENA